MPDLSRLLAERRFDRIIITAGVPLYTARPLTISGMPALLLAISGNLGLRAWGLGLVVSSSESPVPSP